MKYELGIFKIKGNDCQYRIKQSVVLRFFESSLDENFKLEMPVTCHE